MALAFVTGANGFIGQNFVRALIGRGDDVVCLVRDVGRGDGLKKKGARLVVGSLNQPHTFRDALDECEVVYNLAGLTRSLVADELYFVNEVGTRNLAEACTARLTPPTFVQVSSLAASGVSQIGKPRDETFINEPVSEYGRSKLAGELALLPFAAHMPITVLRPPMVLGPGDRISMDMFRIMRRFHFHVMPGRGRNEYAWVDARDLSTAMIAAGQNGERVTAEGHPQGRGIYFVNNVDRTTYIELGSQISVALGGVRYLHAPVPAFLMHRAAKWATVLAAQSGKQEAPYLNRDKAHEIIAGSWSSTSAKIRNQLGFTPPVAPLQRLREIAEWYQNKGWI